MGLDAWLVAKTTEDLKLSKNKTGICNGLFDMTLVANDEFELGYIRNGHDQSPVIFENSYKSDNESCCWFDLTGIKKIIKIARRTLRTAKFDEDGVDINSVHYTYMSKAKWKIVIKMFKLAKKVLKKDPGAEIIYKEDC